MQCVLKVAKSLSHAWCLEGKGTVKVSDAKDDEDEEMGDDDEEPMKMCCMILEGGYTLFEIEKEE